MLSVELIAVTTGSAVAGAAAMAGFVIGTAPLFTLIGYVLRRAGQNVSSYLAGVTGIIVEAIAVWTVSSGLQTGGWLATGAAASATGNAPAAAAPQVAPETGEPQEPVTLDASGSRASPYTPKGVYGVRCRARGARARRGEEEAREMDHSAHHTEASAHTTRATCILSGMPSASRPAPSPGSPRWWGGRSPGGTTGTMPDKRHRDLVRKRVGVAYDQAEDRRIAERAIRKEAAAKNRPTDLINITAAASWGRLPEPAAATPR